MNFIKTKNIKGYFGPKRTQPDIEKILHRNPSPQKNHKGFSTRPTMGLDENETIFGDNILYTCNGGVLKTEN